MRFFRLGIHKPYMGFEYTVGACNCKILETPIGTFTWYDKNCKCGQCKNYICNCEIE